MNNMIDAALGIHPQALSVGARRLELLAENMANSDTPNFKARDIDFRAALSHALDDAGSAATGLTTTQSGHLAGAAGADVGDVQFRVPNQPSLDGNTVDSDMEKAAFTEAAVRYQATLDLIGGRIEGLRKALRGE